MSATASAPPPSALPSLLSYASITPIGSPSASALTTRISELASTAFQASQSDLSMCIRVDKAWFNALVPHLWKTVKIVDFDFLYGPRNGNTRCKPWSVHDICNDHPLRKYGHVVKYGLVSNYDRGRPLGCGRVRHHAADEGSFNLCWGNDEDAEN
ncbi:hypothetical protein BGW39_004758 [Mortierella sp. 14UC]|nr:hypothetical protein BGW39_004758 [Mortierella sp. 14UC]